MQENYFFDRFEVDPLKRTLLKDGDPHPLNPKAFDLLLALVSRHGEVLSKQQLLDVVWRDQFVEEKNLTVHVAALRKALGETKNEHRFIATVPGSGYKFVAKVTGPRPDPDPTNAPREADVPLSSRRFALYAIVTALIAALCLVATVAYTWQSLRKTETSAAEKALSIRRLTSDGKVTFAALSSDGKLFAYSHADGENQSLWLAHTDGGEPVQIRPPAPVSYFDIKFEPDGSAIYFGASEMNGNNGAVYRMPVFGGLQEKVEEKPFYLTFSPKGDEIAYVRGGAEGKVPYLAVSGLNGQNERELAAPPEGMRFVKTSASWSPDGAAIAVAAFNADKDTAYDIFAVAAANGEVKRLTNRAWGYIRSLAWLSDNSGLIVVAQSEGSTHLQLWFVSYPDGEVRHLVSDLNLYGTISTFANDPRKLLTVQGQVQSNIWIAPSADPGQAKQVTFGSIGRQDGWYGIKWMPDGKIAYTVEGSDNSTIWTMSPDGTAQKQLIPSEGDNIYPSASADGRFIVFQSSRGGDYAVWRADRDGGDMLKLTEKGVAAQPDISPDGHWVVYVTSPQGAAELWRMTISGGEPVKLADGASWPRISPDSRSIACGYLSDGKTKVAIFSIDGGDPVHLYDLPRSANIRLGVHWTLDGKAVTYRDWVNGIWRQDLAGGPPERLKGLPEEKLYGYDLSPDGKYLAFTRGSETRDVVLISDFR